MELNSDSMLTNRQEFHFPVSIQSAINTSRRLLAEPSTAGELTRQ